MTRLDKASLRTSRAKRFKAFNYQYKTCCLSAQLYLKCIEYQAKVQLILEIMHSGRLNS